MIVTLLALVLLTLAATAMLRASDTSQVLAGNLAFRRDLANQAERGFAKARTLLVSGALASDTTRTANLLTSNYSAARLTTNASGVPLVLASDAAFASAGMTGSDISENGVTVRYVIDRLCLATETFDTSSCEATAASSSSTDPGGSGWLRKPGGESRPVYRISVRVKGPRDTLAFYQSTFAL